VSRGLTSYSTLSCWGRFLNQNSPKPRKNEFFATFGDTTGAKIQSTSRQDKHYTNYSSSHRLTTDLIQFSVTAKLCFLLRQFYWQTMLVIFKSSICIGKMLHTLSAHESVQKYKTTGDSATEQSASWLHLKLCCGNARNSPTQLLVSLYKISHTILHTKCSKTVGNLCFTSPAPIWEKDRER